MPIPLLINGELPVGEHIATIDEVEMIFGIQNDRRKNLMTGLKNVIGQFNSAGVTRVFIDGSFTSDKEEPADIDGCWSISGHIDETKIDPDFWNFNDELELLKCRKNIKDKYGLDFYIAEWTEGISGKPFPDFFKTNRDGSQKGILKINLDNNLDMEVL